jgi:hypothetical protein
MISKQQLFSGRQAGRQEGKEGREEQNKNLR